MSSVLTEFHKWPQSLIEHAIKFATKTSFERGISDLSLFRLSGQAYERDVLGF